MSDQDVDDLHYAEDVICGISATFKAAGLPDPIATYCRPTCGYMEALTESDGDAGVADQECADDTCGCLCGHPASALERVG